MNRNVILDLEHIKEDRVIEILNKLTKFVNPDSFVAETLIGVIGRRGNEGSIHYLSKFTSTKYKKRANEETKRINSRLKYGEDWFTQYYLQNKDAKDSLLKDLKTIVDERTPYYIEIAGQLNDDRVVPILKAIINKKNSYFDNIYINHLFGYSKNNGETLKIRTALALVKQGELEYMDYLREKMKSSKYDIRLAAADALWDIKNIECIETLMKFLKFRELENGKEYPTLLDFYGTHVEIVRKTCELLGNIGYKKAIPELKKLLELDLRLVRGQKLYSASYSGRPEAVALVKLGDQAGEDFLVKNLSNSLFQDGTIKDLEKLNKRKYINNLIPILDSRGDRVTAAIAIINLLTVGK